MISLRVFVDGRGTPPRAVPSERLTWIVARLQNNLLKAPPTGRYAIVASVDSQPNVTSILWRRK